MPTASRRTDAPTEKRQAIEAAVLEATSALLGEGASYADLNIERIARRAGISRTAFYFYFRDKRDLLMQLTEGVSERLYTAADSWWSGEERGAAELTRALQQIGTLYREHGPLLRAIVEVSTYDEVVATFWRGLVGRFVAATQRRIEREQARGLAESDIPAQATAFALVWMSERTYYQLVVQDYPVKADELVDALVGVWIRSVYGSRA